MNVRKECILCDGVNCHEPKTPVMVTRKKKPTPWLTPERKKLIGKSILRGLFVSYVPLHEPLYYNFVTRKISVDTTPISPPRLFDYKTFCFSLSVDLIISVVSEVLKNWEVKHKNAIGTTSTLLVAYPLAWEHINEFYPRLDFLTRLFFYTLDP